MSVRPFKIVIKDGRHVRVDLTDAEIADAQQRTAAENTERQAKDARALKMAAMMAYLEQLYDSRNVR
jgi:hypothetical protein